MADLILSANMDTLLQAADFAAARTSLGLTTLATTTPGTGVATALAVNIGSAGAAVLFNGALGTPSSGTLTNCTGLPLGSLTDSVAGADRLAMWDQSAGNWVECTVGTGLSFTGTTLSATGGSFDEAGNYTPTGTWDFSTATVTFGTVSITTINATSVVFEGATPDAFETTLGVTEPTADRAINLPNASGDVVLTSSGVLVSNVTLGEAAGNVLLDNALSADGTWSGIAISGTAGATLAFGDLIYLQAADSRWELVDADAAATSGEVMKGICVLAAASDGSATTVLLKGMVRADAVFPTFTIGAPVYAGVTAGDVQVAQPSGTDDVIQVMGYGFTADVLYFNPSGVYITHT